MKSWKIVIPAVLLMCAAVVSQAASASNGPAMKGHWVIGSMGGMAIPSGKLSEEAAADENDNLTSAEMGAGANFGGMAEYFVTDQIGIGADFAFASMTTKNDVLKLVDFKAKTLQFGVHGKWIIPAGEKVLPYLNVGVGMYNRKLEASVPGLSIDFSDSKPGINGGVGLDYMVNSQVGLGASGAYHYSIGKLEDQEFGVMMDNWSYIAFNAALTFHILPK
jgi:outer membrane protein W